MSCEHGGQLRNFVELHRTEGGWEALAFAVRGSPHPEFVVEADDATTALVTASRFIAETAEETDAILREIA